MESHTSTSKVTDASTKHYRPRELLSRNIVFQRSGFAVDKIPRDIVEQMTACERLTIESTFEDIDAQSPFADRTRFVVSAARSIPEQVMWCLQDRAGEADWKETFWTRLVYIHLDSDRELMKR